MVGRRRVGPAAKQDAGNSPPKARDRPWGLRVSGWRSTIFVAATAKPSTIPPGFQPIGYASFGGDEGDDTVGYDFCVKTPRAEWLYEVKSSMEDTGEFELTPNEMRVGRQHVEARSPTVPDSLRSVRLFAGSLVRPGVAQSHGRWDTRPLQASWSWVGPFQVRAFNGNKDIVLRTSQEPAAGSSHRPYATQNRCDLFEPDCRMPYRAVAPPALPESLMPADRR